MQNNDIHGIAIQWTQRSIKKSEHVYTFVEISRLCIMWQLLWGFAKRRPPASFPRPTAHDGQRPGGPEVRWPSPDFPQLFCTDLHRVMVCKMDDGEFEFVYHLITLILVSVCCMLFR